MLLALRKSKQCNSDKTFNNLWTDESVIKLAFHLKKVNERKRS